MLSSLSTSSASRPELVNWRPGMGHRLPAGHFQWLKANSALADSNSLNLPASICIYYFITPTTSDYITWSYSAYLHRCVSDWRLGQELICNKCWRVFVLFFFRYILSISSLGYKTLCIFIKFLVLWSVCLSFFLVDFKKGPEYPTRGTAKVFF